jgi:hypothetical protein
MTLLSVIVSIGKKKAEPIDSAFYPVALIEKVTS